MHCSCPITFNVFFLLIALISKFILYMEADLCAFLGWECFCHFIDVYLWPHSLMFISRVIKDEVGCLRAVMPGGVGGLLGNKPSGGVKCAVYRAQRSVRDTELQFHLAVEVVLHILRFVITLKRRDDYHIQIPRVSSPSRWDLGVIFRGNNMEIQF